MKKLSLSEEAWAVLTGCRIHRINTKNRVAINPSGQSPGGTRISRRIWMPGRPDVQKVVEEEGKKDKRMGAENAWPVDMLQSAMSMCATTLS